MKALQLRLCYQACKPGQKDKQYPLIYMQALHGYLLAPHFHSLSTSQMICYSVFHC